MTSPHHDPCANLAPFTGLAGQRVAYLGAMVTLGVTALWIYLIYLGSKNADQEVFGLDFMVFWSAARLALEGTPVDAFNPDRLSEIHGIEDPGWLPWAYPPAYLLLVMPFGVLGYFSALVSFNLISLAAILGATRGFAAGLGPIWIGVALAPTGLAALFLGQTALLWSAGLMAALWCLYTNRPLLAGIFIGFLTMKPQLGLMIPVALIFAQEWRALLSAALTTIALALLGTFAFGLDYWPAFFQMLSDHAREVRAIITVDSQMVSLYSGLVGFGLPERFAILLQPAFMLIAAVMVALSWSSHKVGFELRASVLIVASLMASPYLWHYEAALLAPLALFLIRAGVLHARFWHIIVLLLLWLGVGPAMLARASYGVLIEFEFPIRLFVSPILALAILITFGAAISRLRAPQ